jgi:hypothetical protein
MRAAASLGVLLMTRNRPIDIDSRFRARRCKFWRFAMNQT